MQIFPVCNCESKILKKKKLRKNSDKKNLYQLVNNIFVNFATYISLHLSKYLIKYVNLREYQLLHGTSLFRYKVSFGRDLLTPGCLATERNRLVVLVKFAHVRFYFPFFDCFWTKRNSICSNTSYTIFWRFFSQPVCYQILPSPSVILIEKGRLYKLWDLLDYT